MAIQLSKDSFHVASRKFVAEMAEYSSVEKDGAYD
jgi:hypothetical protein